MLLNSINFSNLNKINFKSNQNTSQISFTNKPDSFEKNSVSKFEFSEDLSTQARKQIIEKIKTIEDFPLGPLGIGATGAVYQLNNIDGFGYDGVVADIFAAIVLKTALGAFRLSCSAYVSAVKNEPVMGFPSELFSKSCRQILLDSLDGSPV